MSTKLLFVSSILFLFCFSVEAQSVPQCVKDVEAVTVAAERSKDHSAALGKAEDCVKKNPKSLEAILARADVLASKGDYDLAISEANRAIALAPKSAEAYYRRGVIYDNKTQKTYIKDAAASKAFKREASEAAYADYDKALELDPKKGEALAKKMTLKRYFMGSGYPTLIPDYDRAIDMLKAGGDPAKLAEAYYERGNTHALDMRRDLAIADYTSAVQVKPDYAAAYLLRASSYATSFMNLNRNVDAAIADYTRALEIDPTLWRSVYTSRAALYQEKGQLEKAIADYRAALALDPDDYTAKTELAKLAPPSAPPKPATPQAPQPNAEQFAVEGRRQLSQKDYDGAIKSLNECLRIKPDAAPCYAFRGYAKGMKGDLAASNSDHEAAIKLAPNEPALYFVRGMMLVELGNKTGAIAQFRNVLKLDPSNKQAQAALQNLGVDPN